MGDDEKMKKKKKKKRKRQKGKRTKAERRSTWGRYMRTS